MKTHVENKLIRDFARNVLAQLSVLCFFAYAILCQAPPNPIPAQENIQSGAFIIPMDNFHQGNATSDTFNLRAYGLVNLLLQNNIPAKWAIKPGKSKDDVDFTASFTRVAGTAGTAGGVGNFSGGPFIVPQEFGALVTPLISSFNSGPEADVTVYRTTADAMIDIRYTLTHKPKIAIGPDGGGFGSGVHQDLFNSAGISDFESVTDDIINSSSCFTLATQAHSTDPTFVNLYRQFVVSGGNLVLQCASVDTFENNVNGRFQTTLGYSVFGTNVPINAVDTPLVYPEGAMPYNQFIGILANQDGAVTEYAYAPGSGPANGNRISVRNSGADSDKFVATVSQLLGPSQAGGAVFELGGHDYTRTETGASDIAKLNGQRMVLNTVFVPVSRPTNCGLEQATVLGFKSVRRIVNLDGGGIGAGDTIRWTIDYINNSPVAVSNFQIKDIVGANLTLVPGSVTVTVISPGTGVPPNQPTTASANPLYTGAEPNAELLAPDAFLQIGGRIQVTVDMVINLGTPNGTTLLNQTAATGATIVSTTLSDNIDATNTSIFAPDQPQPPVDSVPQMQNPASIDPTTVRILGPTAGSVEIGGQVRDASGNGIRKALVTVRNAGTSETTSVLTNSFGYYSIGDLRAGDLYFVSVSHKRYRFPNSSVSLTLGDNVTGLTFVASPLGKSEAVSGAAQRKK